MLGTNLYIIEKHRCEGPMASATTSAVHPLWTAVSLTSIIIYLNQQVEQPNTTLLRDELALTDLHGLHAVV